MGLGRLVGQQVFVRLLDFLRLDGHAALRMQRIIQSV